MPGGRPELEIRLLGPVEVLRRGRPISLPPSRKLRALLAILVTEARPVGRRRLCELLWDRPNDPRAELRWHLCKLRRVMDDPDRLRVTRGEDEIGLDLGDCRVDAREVLPVEGRDPPGLERLAALAGLFRGRFLGELDLAGTRAEIWLAAQRRRYAARHVAILRTLVAASEPAAEATARHTERWLELAPCDPEAHGALLEHLIRRGRIAEAEAHLAGAERLFAEEGVPTSELRRVWARARSRPPPASASAAGASAPTPAPAREGTARDGPRRSALAVMPFTAADGDPSEDRVAEGLTRDIITRLAKLRCLSIIALGSVDALAKLGLSGVEAGRRLGVDYVASGSLRAEAGRLGLAIELVEVRSERIVASEMCEARPANPVEALDQLGDRVTAVLMGEIEQAERDRAVLRPPASLDAWGALHRGLWHMYRFTKEENARARGFFDRATRLDPTFSRAHAGLSFTHWQNAFQNWADPLVEAERAYAAAARGLLADERDPAAHWAMGRALWLRRRHDQAVGELRRSVALSPSFALGHYALAFVESQTGDPIEAIRASNTSRQLSPFDPLMFGMLGSRAIAHLRLGAFEEAADWAARAAARPNAHINILGLAALCLALASRVAEGRAVAATIHATDPRYGIADFLRAFHFSPRKAELLRAAAARVSLA